MKTVLTIVLMVLLSACIQVKQTPCPEPQPWIPQHHCVMLPEHVGCCVACDRMRAVGCNPFDDKCEGACRDHDDFAAITATSTPREIVRELEAYTQRSLTCEGFITAFVCTGRPASLCCLACQRMVAEECRLPSYECESACQDGGWGLGVQQATSKAAIEDVIKNQTGEPYACGWPK